MACMAHHPKLATLLRGYHGSIGHINTWILTNDTQGTWLMPRKELPKLNKGEKTT